MINNSEVEICVKRTKIKILRYFYLILGFFLIDIIIEKLIFREGINIYDVPLMIYVVLMSLLFGFTMLVFEFVWRRYVLIKIDEKFIDFKNKNSKRSLAKIPVSDLKIKFLEYYCQPDLDAGTAFFYEGPVLAFNNPKLEKITIATCNKHLEWVNPSKKRAPINYTANSSEWNKLVDALGLRKQLIENKNSEIKEL